MGHFTHLTTRCATRLVAQQAQQLGNLQDARLETEAGNLARLLLE
jgi:hypothetical protein